MTNPLDQFIIKPVFEINILKYCLIFTNSTIAFIFSYSILIFLIYITFKKINIISKEKQALGEIVVLSIKKTLIMSAGKKSEIFLGFILTIFLLILISNISGMIPYNFTATSHICVTITLSILVFSIVTFIGFYYNKIMYLKILMPEGTPLFLAPLIIMIELFAYFARPVSLAIRLAANMTAGHVVLKVLATFSIVSGYLGIIPFILLTILTGFEIFICVLQAYIFTVLTCAYLNDALNLH